MEDFLVTIPKSSWNDALRDMRSRLQTWEWRWKPAADSAKLILDFTRVQMMEPWGLAMFTAYALEMRERHGLLLEARLDDSSPSNRYFAMMGLEEVLKTGLSNSQWDTDRQNTGLHVIRGHADVNRFVKSAGQLGRGPDDETMDAMKYGMTELARNVVQHAGAAVGGVAIAQYFPQRQSVQIVLCDTGCGVRAALSARYPEIQTDLEALKVAVLPHASGAQPSGPYSSSDNAGLGLFFCKEIAWRAGGGFWLVSGRALLGVTGQDDAARHRVYRSNLEPWPGTLVAMDFPAVGVADFAALLQLCQTLAQQARAQPGVAGLDVLAEVPAELSAQTISVAEFLEDVGRAATVRDTIVRPKITAGELVVFDFNGVRFITQSFAHALLYELFRIPGSLGKLSFVNCSRATVQALQTVAAYAASYRMHLP